MSERLIVYRVRSWRHSDCYLPSLDLALAHARRDLDCAHPGEVAVTRRLVSPTFWEGLTADCDHPGMDGMEPEGEAEEQAAR